jgi:hypothetical protein
MAKKDTVHYENNPILIGLDGLKLFFSLGRQIAIYSVVATAIGLMVIVGMFAASIAEANTMTEAEFQSMERRDAAAWKQFLQPDSPDDVIVPIAREVGMQFVVLVFSLLLFGVFDYAAARTALNKKAELAEGFKVVIKEFPGYLWLYVLFTIKVLLWSLLLIIPGIIMFYRYILSGTVFFAEGKRGNAAIKRSAELTKGKWLTTYAGTSVWPIISQGLAYYIFMPGSLAVLYRQFTSLEKAQAPAPKAHIISWLTLLVPIALFVLLILLIALLAALLTLGARG